jgi:hypothetical protein
MDSTLTVKDLNETARNLADSLEIEVDLELINTGSRKIESLLKKMVVDAITVVIDSGVRSFINTHNGKEEKLEAVVYLENDYMCPVFAYNLCSLNKLYFGKDGKIYLSDFSIGETFGRCSDQTDGSMESFMQSAVKEYNKNSYTKIISYKVI